MAPCNCSAQGDNKEKGEEHTHGNTILNPICLDSDSSVDDDTERHDNSEGDRGRESGSNRKTSTDSSASAFSGSSSRSGSSSDSSNGSSRSDEGYSEEDEPYVGADDQDDDSDDLEGVEPIGGDRQPDLISRLDAYYFEDEDKAAIGDGSHGTVYRVTNSDGHEFALKANMEDDTEKWSMEKDVLKATHHRHVVSLHDAFEYDGVAYLVLERCPHGTLEEYMTRSGRLPESDVKIFGRALAEGVLHLHTRGFLHRDLKPENILLGEGRTLKVADFGLALAYHNKKGTGIFGTYGFIAAELARMENHTRKMDVWGVGALIYFMLYGDKPHFDEASGVYVPPITYLEPCKISNDAQEVLNVSLRIDVKDRLTLQRLLKLPFFAVSAPAQHYGPPSFRPPSIPPPPPRRPIPKRYQDKSLSNSDDSSKADKDHQSKKLKEQ